MKPLFTKNLSLKLISLLLGFIIWQAVSSEQGIELTFSIPIELRNLPEGFEVIKESVHQADVRLRGTAEILRSLSPQDISIAVDLSGAEPGERVAYLTPSDVTAPFGSRVMRVTPALLEIELDRTLEKTVNIIPRVSDAPAEGFELAGIHLSPKKITVIGPESHIQNLEQITTVPLSAEGLRQSFSRTVRLELNPLIRLAHDANVELTLDVRELRVQLLLSSVKILTQPETTSVTVEPETIDVLLESPRSLVEQLNAEKLIAEIDLSQLNSGIHTVVPAVRMLQPNTTISFEIIEIRPNTVEVRVQ